MVAPALRRRSQHSVLVSKLEQAWPALSKNKQKKRKVHLSPGGKIHLTWISWFWQNKIKLLEQTRAKQKRIKFFFLGNNHFYFKGTCEHKVGFMLLLYYVIINKILSVQQQIWHFWSIIRTGNVAYCISSILSLSLFRRNKWLDFCRGWFYSL